MADIYNKVQNEPLEIDESSIQINEEPKPNLLFNLLIFCFCTIGIICCIVFVFIVVLIVICIINYSELFISS